MGVTCISSVSQLREWIILSMYNMYSVDIWQQASDFLTPGAPNIPMILTFLVGERRFTAYRWMVWWSGAYEMLNEQQPHRQANSSRKRQLCFQALILLLSKYGTAGIGE